MQFNNVEGIVMSRRSVGTALAMALTAAAIAILNGRAMAQPAPPAASPPPAAALSVRIEKLSGVWIEGPGFEITYGGTFDACAQRCLTNGRCVMIEYYRPEKKCNLYDMVRPRKTGGSSDVGIKR